MGEGDFEILQTALENLEIKKAFRITLVELIAALQSSLLQSSGWLDDEASADDILVYNLDGQIIVFLPEYLRRSQFRFTETGKT